MSRRIGFIGGGRIARIFLAALKRSGYACSNVSFSESSSEAATVLLRDFPEARRLDQAGVAAASDLLFIALPPAIIIDAISGGRLEPRADAIVVSLAPKVSLSAISKALGGFNRVVRMLPNAPSIVGAGYNPVCFGPVLKEAERKTLRELFAAFGEQPEVEESKLEAYAVLTAMGPTYFFFQFYELTRIAKGFGFSEDEASAAIRAMLSGSVATAFDSGLKSERVLDLVSSRPLAANEEAIKAMYETALRGIYAKLTT